MKPHIAALITALVFCHAAAAIAGDAQSPPLKIVALEVLEGENVLRLMMRRRLEDGTPSLSNFNPANCTLLTNRVNDNGKDVGSRHHFDLQLGIPARTAAQQQELVKKAITAFITSLPLTLYVPDSSCTSAGSRAVSGIRVLR